jgi:chromodomain-helicase-DNA-binding protein 1
LSYSDKYPLWEKQQEAVTRSIKRLRKDKGVCLLCDPGTGKTRITIEALEYLFRAKDARLIYIVAPLTAMHVWIEEWHKWAMAPVAFIDLHESGSPGLRYAKKLASEGWPVICLVNYEASWQIGHSYVERTRKGEKVRIHEKTDTAMFDLDWDVGVMDECDATKTAGAKVSKFFRHKMRDKTDYRMILTGTAYTKRPLDVWAPVNYACKDEVFPKVFLPFKNMYSIPHPQIRGAVVGYQNLNDFTWRLSQIAILLKKEDMFDLPPQIHQTRMVELSSKSRRLYDTLKAEAYAELEESGDTITANHIFTAMRKLMQVTSGFVIPDVDDPEAPIEAVRLGKEKLAELMELLDTRGEGPVIIVTQANEEERIIAEALRKEYQFVPKVLNGSVKGAENRHRMIAEAANDRAFIVKESVGARGVDMRWADTTIFFSHSYSTSAYQQMLSRNHRGGQEKSITYYHLLCRDTIDMAVWGALRRDLNLAASIEKDWRKLFE